MSESKKIPLLNLELQLADKLVSIVIFEGDDLEESVDKFCIEHKLNSKIKTIIMKQLIDKVNENISQSNLNSLYIKLNKFKMRVQPKLTKILKVQRIKAKMMKRQVKNIMRVCKILKKSWSLPLQISICKQKSI